MPAVGPDVKYALIAAASVALLLPTGALAAKNGVTVQDAWMRIIVPSRPAAGYFTLHNNSNASKALTAASSPACKQLMLHESLHKGGQDQMAMTSEVAVPPNGSVSFAPGGYHLMCMQPASSMRPGATVPVTLRFKDGGTLTQNFIVRGPTGK
jgi:copper(I)-binding protein